MKKTPLQWKVPEVGDLAVIHNGLGHPFYVLILEIKEEIWPIDGKKKIARVQWLNDSSTSDLELARLKVV